MSLRPLVETRVNVLRARVRVMPSATGPSLLPLRRPVAGAQPGATARAIVTLVV
jgi:hypothetical protein